MPNKNFHVLAGAIAGVGYSLHTLPPPTSPLDALAKIIGAAAGGAYGGRFPDVLEPAHSSQHRSTAHSYSTAITMATMAKTLRENWESYCSDRVVFFEQSSRFADNEWRRLWYSFVSFVWRVLGAVISGLLAGYVSHLGFDALTAKGLPLI